MRIAFDGTSLRPRRTGVGYYTEHLLHHLAQEASEDEVIVVSNRPIDTTAPLPARVRVVTSSRRVPRMVWMQTGARRALREMDVDVAHFTNGMVPIASPVPTVVTIHDMSLRLYPGYHPPRRVLLNRPLVDLAARRADAVITVSESAKRDIVGLYGLDPGRVHVVYEAAAPAFRPVHDLAERERVRRQYGLEDRIILYVGTVEPRKNLPVLIEAFAARRRAGDLRHQLVCAGPYGWLSRGLEDLIDRLNVRSAITFTGYVPFADLPVLYSLAEMFVYPSLYEGFGLPVIEAMACGVPVITGRTAALAEVGGCAVEQVERLEPDAVGEAMVALARDGERRAELAARGRARAERFSWTRAARESLAIYRRVANNRGEVRLKPDLRPVMVRLKPEPTEMRGVRLNPDTTYVHSGGVRLQPDRHVDVLFGQAYFLRFDPKLWTAQQPYAPLGALYAAACARARGYTVALFDAMLAKSEDEWTAALDRHRPRVAVIYEDSFNYLSKMCLLRMRQAALTMIDAARARGIVTVVAGSDASDHPATYLDRGAAAVIVGEGEVTLVELLDALCRRQPGSLREVAGLALRDEDGRLVRTRSREIIRDLDALPLPAWDLVDVERYQTIWRQRHGYYSMNLVTTRGCPYHCNWCAKPIYGQRYTSRSPAHVVEEMAWLQRTYHPDHLWMADDIFGLKPGWIEEFAELLRQRGAAIPFKCLLRADQVTVAVARALGASRCRTVWIGAESGSQRILDAMEKGTRTDQIATATRLLREAGIEVGFFLQFGYPGETGEDILKTLEMVRACRPDDIGVSVSYPLPGTTFYQRVQTQLGHKQNWVDSSDLDTMYRATYVPAFYRSLHALVHSEFRVWKAAASVGRAVRRPWSLRQRHARDAACVVYYGVRIPLLQWRLGRLARLTAPPTPALRLPLSNPQAAAIPTDQASLESKA